MKKFIRYKDYKMFFSDNNWKEYSVLKCKSTDADEETDEDICAEVKLRYELGERKARIIIDILKDIQKRFNPSAHDGYGHAFEIFAIATLYNIDYNIAYKKYIVNGSKDGKVDAIYWCGEKVFLYQIKLGYFDSDDLKTMRDNHREFIRTGKITSPDSHHLLEFYEKHKSEIIGREDSEIVIISDNYTDKNSFTPKQIFDLYFKNQLIQRNNNIKLTLDIPNIDNNLILLNGKEVSVYAYFEKAEKLIRTILKCEQINNKSNIDKLFYDNVRGYLGTNKNMEDTINKEPSNFIKYNNGITITGNVTYNEGNLNIVIENPTISNGQQTLVNLLELYPNVKDVYVLVIVKNDTNTKIKGKIARFTNEQKTIKPIDLLSLNEAIRELQGFLFNSNNNFFLNINTSGKKSYNDMLKRLYDRNKIITLSEFLRLYFATEDLKFGSWKNNVSTKLKELLDSVIAFDNSKALKICKVIESYRDYLGTVTDKKAKNDLKVADLIVMFLSYKYRYTIAESYAIVTEFNRKYFYDLPEDSRKSKLIDLYKVNDIYEKYMEFLKEKKKVNQSMEEAKNNELKVSHSCKKNNIESSEDTCADEVKIK